MLFRDLLQAYKQSPEWASLALRSKGAYHGYLSRFSEKSSYRLLEVSTDRAVSLIEASREASYWGEVLGAIESIQARRAARRVLVTLFNWGARAGLLIPDALRGLPTPKMDRKDYLPFSKDEVLGLLALAEGMKCPETHVTYIRAACFAFFTGMRPSEVSNLLWTDIREGFAHIRGAKHRQAEEVSRICKITDLAARALPAGPQEGLVFKTTRGFPLDKNKRGEVLKWACRKVGIPEREFYATRRGTATEMHKAGYDIVAIGDQLGHRDIKTTQLYLHPTRMEKAARFKGF